MNKRVIIFLSLLLIFSPLTSNAQFFSKGPSKEQLMSEIAKLKRIIDSLKYELASFQIPLADTTSINDTINPGGIEFLDMKSPQNKEGEKLSTDSLLSIWYSNKPLNYEEFEVVDLDSLNFKSDIPDSVFVSRLKALNSFIPLPYNQVVKNHIIFYTQKIPGKIDLILGLANYYMPQFEEIFDEYNLPKELKIMAVIESALNPTARSRANAKGMWQFMFRTALQYNLEINSYVDERLDPIKSGHAAAKYLRDSYTIFGDWALAIASYNCGAGNVNKAIRRAGSRDFWKIYPYLPRETRGYVPSFVAALYTLNYYKEHRIPVNPIQMPAHIDTFIIRKPLHFNQISELTGIPKDVLTQFNPQYINEIIPGSEKGYVLKLPYNYTSMFLDKENEVYSYKDSVYFNPLVEPKSRVTNLESQRSITHKVKSGETLGGIAMKYNVRLSDLQRWNGVKTNIRVGQRLIIYSKGYTPSTAHSRSVTTSLKNGYITYKIRSGDTLWEIAKKFEDVSLNDILKLNGLTKNSKIMPGTVLKIKEA